MSDLWTSSANPLGEREVDIKIRFDDETDWANKLRSLADNLDKLGNKPVWLVRLELNCCSGGYP